jgi:ribose 5-phosphate isomerase B
MDIALGADHAGYDSKLEIRTLLLNLGHTVVDFGTNSLDSMDYPDVAHPLSNSVANNENDFGILICGSANGMAMTANKNKDIRAAICWDVEIAALARKHNNANILCLPARFISNELASQIVETFLTAAFEFGRHELRVNKIQC